MPIKATVRQQQCAALLCAQGYMPSGASALVGNFSQESGTNLAVAWRHGKLDHGSQGLAQWRLDRLDKYEAWVCEKCDLNHNTTSADQLWAAYGRLDLQCEYVAVEMQRDYPKLHEALLKGGSVSALTAMICWQFERPSKLAANLDNRITQALAVFNTMPGGASHAHETDIRAALDKVADSHAKTAAQGGATVAAGGVLGAVAGIAHFASRLDWIEWTMIAIVAFLLIVGFTVLIVGSTKAQLVRNAKAQVDPSILPAKPIVDPRDVNAKHDPGTDPSKQAHDAEQAAIDAAMHPKPTTQIVWPPIVNIPNPSDPLPEIKRSPLMSVHPGAAS